MFKKNLNLSGRIPRFSIAAFLFLLAIWQNSWIILTLSLFVFFEALMSWCVIYQLLGKNACSIKLKTPQNDRSEEQ